LKGNLSNSEGIDLMRSLYCISCPAGCQLTVTGYGDDVAVEGNKCDKGVEFAQAETSNPTRTLTTTVRTKFPGVPVLSVRTDGEIPKDLIMDAMSEINQVIIETEMGCGDILIENILDTGISVIVTGTALMQLGAELENKNEILKSGVASGGAAVAMGGGVGIVRNAEVLDHIGIEAAGGFVGTAGNAVGVENPEDEDEFDDDEETEEESGGVIRKQSRPHIKRR
jgi:CxxC motif-containing protein